jgi:hypothetical protein
MASLLTKRVSPNYHFEALPFTSQLPLALKCPILLMALRTAEYEEI